MASSEDNITVDPEFMGDQTEYEDDSGDSSMGYSFAASIYEYRYENGRRYHAYKDGKYAMPNDEAEQDRLDVLHHIYILLFKGDLHMAPMIPDPLRILDVGTGTGIWAIDMAETYPNAHVIGTDLSPIQPSLIPPNVEFQVDDAESEWTYGEDVFDMVHIRNLNGSIGDWGSLIQEAYKAIKPGGWLEIQEYELFLVSDDGSLPNTSYLYKYYELINQAAEKIGREFKIAAALDPLIREKGFTDLHHERMKLPFGTWPADPRQKEMGAYLLLTAETAFEGFAYGFLTRAMGMEIEAVEDLVRKAMKDSKSRSIHSYCPLHVYWAQKPL